MTDTFILSGSEESRPGPSAWPQDDLRGGPSPRAQDDLRVGFSPASVLTRAELLDHARHPRNRGELQGADIVWEESNLLCGDVVTVYARIERAGSSPTSYQLQATSFTGSGCIISQAAASMLSEDVVGKPLTDIERMERADVEALLGAIVSPSRVKCAMLALLALKNGIQRHAVGS